MSKYLLLFLFLPHLLMAQSKRKLRIIEEQKQILKKKQFDTLVSNLKQHVGFLANDKLEGRRSGSKGEELAKEYLINFYDNLNIEKTNNNFAQSFEINDGKSYINDQTFLNIENNEIANDLFIPLHFSASKKINSYTSLSLRESNEVWIFDIKEVVDENANNPHFDLLEYLYNQSIKYQKNGAGGLIFINTSNLNTSIVFDKKSKKSSLEIPVVYAKPQLIATYFKDQLASFHIKMSVNLQDDKRVAHNVIGFINNNATNTIILGAHYDHLGFGEDKNALDTANDIHNGADDNASGTAALLELARLLKLRNSKNNNFLFIHFSGEELGLLGSKYWLENPTISINPNCMINMDMVGRYDTARKLTIGGFGTSPTWGQLLPNINSLLNIKYDSTGGGPSDHASFYRKDIPVLFFFTGSHSDYHKTTDDSDKINYTGEAEIVQYIVTVIDSLDNKSKLPFLKTAEPKMGKSSKFTVSLGVIPDYGYSGEGVRIDGVSPNKLAEKIGLKGGDVLLQLGQNLFSDVTSYMNTLSKFKKGDSTTLKVRRGTEQLSFEITF